MKDKKKTKIPNYPQLLHLSPKLLYSSSLVEQTYYSIYGDKIPAKAPQNYMDLAVLEKRKNGVGVKKKPFNNPKNKNPDSDSRETISIPVVYKVTGNLSVSQDEEHDDMFVNRLNISNSVYTGFGSKENYHPIIQNQVVNNGTFFSDDVWATLTELSETATEEGDVHFCQIALQEDIRNTE